jgi:hypothetical protein
MPSYTEASQAFRSSLLPLREFCQRERGSIDPGDPKQGFRFRRVVAFEHITEAAADFGKATNALINPPASPLIQRLRAHIDHCAAIQANPQLALAHLPATFPSVHNQHA